MPKQKWITKKRIEEGGTVYMPGDVYKGVNADRLCPTHPWIKAGWLEPEQPEPSKSATENTEKDTEEEETDTSKSESKGKDKK